MRGILRFALLGCSLAFVASACSGGDDDDDGGFDPGLAGGTLTSGTYGISHWDGGADGCRSNTSLNGETITVTVAGTSLAFGTLGGVIYGSAFNLAQTDALDFATQPYPFGIGPFDCTVSLSESLDGLTFGADRALVDRTIEVAVVSGAECADVEEEISDLAGGSIDFPCTTEASFFMEKTGP